MAIFKKGNLCRTDAATAYDLLTEVADLIEAEPGNYNQHHWKMPVDMMPGNIIEEHKKNNGCGTMCCVAGWIDELTEPSPVAAGRNTVTGVVEARGAEKLGMTIAQARPLFYGHAIEGSQEWLDAGCPIPGSEAFAKLGANHIRRFRDQHEARLRKKKI